MAMRVYSSSIMAFLCLLSGSLSGACQFQLLGDLNNDCQVDFNDLALMASNWLINCNRTPDDPACVSPNPLGIDWVSISDPGIDGHEGFVGEMSKYETTNAQYCMFLNAALTSGDISINGNDAIGANGSNTGQDFIGQIYYDGDGAGFTDTGGGLTNAASARIKFESDRFIVIEGFEDHPVTYVNWYGATAFCEYYGFHLPTQWQWQAVADYDGSFEYGCGNSIDSAAANYYYSNHPDGTTVVGSFGEYGYGICDMAGNLFEWTNSCREPGCDGGARVIRGGGWGHGQSYCNVTSSPDAVAFFNDYSIGFRVCR